LQPTCQCVPGNSVESGNATHAWSFFVSSQNLFFLRFSIAILRIQNTGFLAVFAEILLVTITVLAVFLQVAATATATCVDFLFDYHRHSLIETFSLNHYRNLIYQNESGALNEAFSDMMGTAIEFYYGTGNWTIGEDITVGSNGIRNMANPGEDGDPSYYADRYTGTSDNGGVHTNSGIANHWFYLLVNGGQNANSARASGTNVQGVGLTAAEQITFLGFTALPSGATFCDARAGTIAVGGSHSANVADAWDEVGVTDALCNGGGGGGGGNGALDVTVTTDKPSYVVREKVVITVNVKDGNGTAVSGAAVTVTIDTPGNFRYSGSASSGTDGNAVFNFTPNKRDGTGTFTVSATASKSGYTTGADSTTFTVQ